MRPGLVLLGLGLADQFGGFVAPRLRLLQPGEKRAQAVIAIQNIGGQVLRIGQPAALQGGGKGFGVFANGADIVHGAGFLNCPR